MQNSNGVYLVFIWYKIAGFLCTDFCVSENCLQQMLDGKKIEVALFNDLYILFKRRPSNYVEIIASVTCNRDILNLDLELSTGRMIIKRIDGNYKIILAQSEHLLEIVASIKIHQFESNISDFEPRIQSLDCLSLLLRTDKIKTAVLDGDQIFYQCRSSNIMQILAYSSIPVHNLVARLNLDEIQIIILNGKQNIVEKCGLHLFKILSHIENTNLPTHIDSELFSEVHKMLAHQKTSIKIFDINRQQVLAKFENSSMLKIIAFIEPYIDAITDKIKACAVDSAIVNGVLKIVETDSETGVIRIIATLFEQEVNFGNIGQCIFLCIDGQNCIGRFKGDQALEIIANISFVNVANVDQVPIVLIPVKNT